MHNDILEICRSSGLATALVLNFAGVQWGNKHWSVVDKSDSLIFSVRLHAWSNTSVGGVATVLAEAIMVSKEEDKAGQIVQ